MRKLVLVVALLATLTACGDGEPSELEKQERIHEDLKTMGCIFGWDDPGTTADDACQDD